MASGGGDVADRIRAAAALPGAPVVGQPAAATSPIEYELQLLFLVHRSLSSRRPRRRRSNTSCSSSSRSADRVQPAAAASPIDTITMMYCSIDILYDDIYNLSGICASVLQVCRCRSLARSP
ncbi:hypothetical protein [Cohnella soli]|uniref:Uncharacterized protein n=1 Tax=Cohnella soli TaxID=425005 RepID=A0ABW0HPG3_9BACL